MLIDSVIRFVYVILALPVIYSLVYSVWRHYYSPYVEGKRLAGIGRMNNQQTGSLLLGHMFYVFASIWVTILRWSYPVSPLLFFLFYVAVLISDIAFGQYWLKRFRERKTTDERWWW